MLTFSSQGWRGDRHQMWSRSRSADGCVGRGEITKKVVLIKIQNSKNPKYKEGGLDKNPCNSADVLPNMWHEYQQISGQGHSTSTETIQDVCPRGSWKTWQGDILFLSKINTAKMFGGIVKKQNSSQRSEQNKTSRWIINIFLLQHHFGQVQQDKEKHSKKNVSELRVSTEYHHLNLNSWYYHAAAPDKLRI